MAVFIAQQARNIFLNNTHNYLAIESNQINSSASSTMEICFNNSPDSGDTWLIKWDGKEVLLTFAPQPDDSGYQLPTNTTGDYTQWANDVYECLIHNAALVCDFVIERISLPNGLECVRFTHRTVDPIVIESTVSNPSLTVNVNNSIGAFNHPNHKAYVKVWEVNPFGNNRIVVHNGKCGFTSNKPFRLKKALALSVL